MSTHRSSHPGGPSKGPTTIHHHSNTNNNNPNPKLAASLRQSQSQPSDSSAAAASQIGGSRIQMGEKGEWISAKGIFVNYLPQDEAVAAGLGADEGGLDALESQRVVDILNRELSKLLKLNPKQFWKQVATDASLHEFLESFLQFRSRWYDFPHRGAKETVAGVVVGEFELSRRVFMVLYRISSNRDPGARAADSISSKDHAALLQDKKLLDLPKLLDICAIYSHENEDLTGVLVGNAVKAHPSIYDNLTTLASHFLSLEQTMYQHTITKLEALLSGIAGENGYSSLLVELLEAMDFFNDAIVSMDAFLTAYKPSAIFFMCSIEKSYGNGEILRTLARLHDSLLPSLRRGFSILASGEAKMSSNVAISLKMLSTRIVKFGWKLLESCYLSDEVFSENIPIPAAAEMFPAKLEDLCIRADILVQMLREINGISVGARGNQNMDTFLQNVEKNFNLMGRVESLKSLGWLIMDDEHLGYLSGILMSSEKVIGKPHTDGTIPLTNNKVPMDEDFAIMESKISQVKDLFPEYGKGFLAACLEAYNQNPEEVIQRILEGTLHEDLQSLDTKLETMPKPRSAPTVSKSDKGKGILVEPTAASNTNSASKNDKGKGILVEPTSSTNTNSVVMNRVQQIGAPAVTNSVVTNRGQQIGAPVVTNSVVTNRGQQIGAPSVTNSVVTNRVQQIGAPAVTNSMVTNRGQQIGAPSVTNSVVTNRVQQIGAPAVTNSVVTDRGQQIGAPSVTNSVVTNRGQQIGAPSVSLSSSQGRFVRKSKAGLPASETLDDFNERYSAKTAVLVSQFEYEDEYDDSFDDLGLSVADSGAGEIESFGSKSNSNMGKPWETRNEGSSQLTSSKWGSRQAPQYYVKDGKNYSYKVAGSVAVANMGEATLITQAQQELIHGLGRGGNLPLGAVKKLTEYSEQQGSRLDIPPTEGSGRSNSWGRGGERRNEEQDCHSDNSQREGRGRGYIGNSRGGRERGRGEKGRGDPVQEQDSRQTAVSEAESTENTVNQRGRGRRGGGGGSNHYRKDQAMKKHFSGLGGF